MTKPPSPMVILIDSREQRPFAFEGMGDGIDFTTKTVALREGDYSLEYVPETPYRDRIVVERKSLEDLYGSLTNGRERFERECARLSCYGAGCLVIEASLAAIENPDGHMAHPTMANPRSILASLASWSLRFNLHIWPCPSRQFAERLTFDLLRRWHLRHQPVPAIRRRAKVLKEVLS